MSHSQNTSHKLFADGLSHAVHKHSMVIEKSVSIQSEQDASHKYRMFTEALMCNLDFPFARIASSGPRLQDCYDGVAVLASVQCVICASVTVHLYQQ